GWHDIPRPRANPGIGTFTILVLLAEQQPCRTAPVDRVRQANRETAPPFSPPPRFGGEERKTKDAADLVPASCLCSSVDVSTAGPWKMPSCPFLCIRIAGTRCWRVSPAPRRCWPAPPSWVTPPWP